jgi:hypothetical protein
MLDEAYDLVVKFYSLLKEGNYAAIPALMDETLLERTAADQLIQIFRSKMEESGQLMTHKMEKVIGSQTNNGLNLAKALFTVDYWKKGQIFEYFEMVYLDNQYKIYMYEYSPKRSSVAKDLDSYLV